VNDLSERAVTGLWGEVFAARYLRDNGFEILSANYRTRFGEIDLVVSDGINIVFAEVKTRKDGIIAPPAEAVNYAKQRRLSASAAQYLNSFKTALIPRFDVIEVYMGENEKPIEIKHIKSAFETVR